jgi:hypothetical protein
MKQIVEIDGAAQAYEVRDQGSVTIVHSGGPGIDSAYLRLDESGHFGYPERQQDLFVSTVAEFAR